MGGFLRAIREGHVHETPPSPDRLQEGTVWACSCGWRWAITRGERNGKTFLPKKTGGRWKELGYKEI